eukprot:Gb_11429 [translate_table: standard]
MSTSSIIELGGGACPCFLFQLFAPPCLHHIQGLSWLLRLDLNCYFDCDFSRKKAMQLFLGTTVIIALLYYYGLEHGMSCPLNIIVLIIKDLKKFLVALYEQNGSLKLRWSTLPSIEPILFRFTSFLYSSRRKGRQNQAQTFIGSGDMGLKCGYQDQNSTTELLKNHGPVFLILMLPWLQIWTIKKSFSFSSMCPGHRVLYSLGGLENLKMARKYYAAAIDLSGGRNTRALYVNTRQGIVPELGILSEMYSCCQQSAVQSAMKCTCRTCSCTDRVYVMNMQCGVAINQLTKGRSREEKENSDLQSLAAAALVKDYKQRSPEKAPLVTSVLEQMKAFS